MKLNILNGRIERCETLMKELASNGIDDFELWGDIHDSKSVIRTINKSHKQIIEYAKEAKWPEVAIAEDDIKFSHPNSWNYFLSQKPEIFDLYLGMVYLGHPNENGQLTRFTGMTIYICHSRFYDRFLATQEDEHIDVALGGRGRYFVCQPFIAMQYNGYSSNTGKNEVYDDLLRERCFYQG